MGIFTDGLMGFCVLWVRPLLTFRTQKYVVIWDWKLGLLLRLVQIGILAYVLWSIFQQEGYLLTQVPNGAVQAFTEGGENYTVEAMHDAFTSKQYCTHPELYSFYYNHRFTYNNFSCIVSDPNGFSKKQVNSIQIDTYFASQKAFSKAGNNEKECESFISNDFRSEEGVPNYAKFMGLVNGDCFFSTVDSIFAPLPEEKHLSITHRFSTSSQIGYNDVQPTTYLRDLSKTKILKTWQAGEEINELVSTWLKWAELELDLPMNEQPAYVKGHEPIPDDVAKYQNYINQGLNLTLVPQDQNKLVYARMRVTGVVLLFKMQYYNWRLSPIKDSLGNTGKDFHCVMDLKPILGWAGFGRELHYSLRDFQDPRFMANVNTGKHFKNGFLEVDIYRYGINVMFEASGDVGRFEVTKLIQSITSGIVLLAFANTIVTMIAMYGRGLHSIMYRELINEKVDWRREYARFAAQAIVGAYVFNLIDTDQTGTLNGSEIYAVLRSLFGHRMSSDELASVTDFVLTNGNDESDKRDLKRLQNQVDNTNVAQKEITLDEWMHIFSTNKASIATMSRAIEGEYKSEKPRVTLEMINQKPGPAFQGLSQDSFHDSASGSSLDLWMTISRKQNIA
eukprot:TRINITY_DN896_c0_g1_i6.p1 TRINITY_DN896_c0_g1~~TRINITY_DN896_c0_g1_i6.p1  ORF type:complete len:619 (+),score=72.65 TRINITY_DN896_c0_g1_i6:498-2354(+)